MSDPRKQHTVPRCYLREFRDPSSTAENPFIWIFEKDGKKSRRDKVKNVLVVNHAYTIKVAGKNNYAIEKTLSDVEGAYATVYREKISARKPLTSEDHQIVCLFAAVMMLRTARFKQVVEKFIGDIADHVYSMETQHNAAHTQSEELEKLKTEMHQKSIFEQAPKVTEIMMSMSIAFLCSNDSGAKFITSDDPCNLFNPKLQWDRSLFNSPGLGQKDTQVTLPLSPDTLLCLSRSNVRGYIQIPKNLIHEQNRMIRGFAHKYFIAHSPKLKRSWFRMMPWDIGFWLEYVIRRILAWRSRY